MPALFTQGASILTAIEARVVQVTGLDPTAVKIVVQRTPPRFTADHDVLIRLRRVQSLQPTNDASGRVATLVTRFLSVYPRTRLETDETDREDLWLKDQTRGHLTLEEQVLSALQDFQPLDPVDQTSWLLVEPMRLLSSGELEMDPADNAWGWESIDFEMKYLLLVDQSYQ